MADPKEPRHKWMPDHDKLVYCCVRLNIKKEGCIKVAEAIGIDYKTKFLPRYKDYKDKISGANKRTAAGKKEDDTANFFRDKLGREINEIFERLLNSYNLNYDEIIKNKFAERTRVSGTKNVNWTEDQLLMAYMASRLRVGNAEERKKLSELSGVSQTGFDAKYYGFNFLNGTGRDDKYTKEMKDLVDKYQDNSDDEILSKVQSAYPSFKESKVTIRKQVDDMSALEGMLVENKGLRRKRNAQLADERKKKDDYTCQACGFRLQINGKYVIDCHHKNPLSENEPTVTDLDELVSLCPRCHRIAHTINPPLDVVEIKEIVQT